MMFDNKFAQEKAAHIQAMIFDVDGILTDGRIQFSEQGEWLKDFYVHDGLGIQLLHAVGITTALISARQTPIVTKRAADLGIRHVYQGMHNKREHFTRFLEASGLEAHECGFMGDDIVDIPLLKSVHFAVSVPNAHVEAKKYADYITTASGGWGAVREVCDFILHAQHKYEQAMAPYLL